MLLCVLLLSLGEVPKIMPHADAPVHRLQKLWDGGRVVKDRGGKHEAEVFQCASVHGSCFKGLFHLCPLPQGTNET